MCNQELLSKRFVDVVLLKILNWTQFILLRCVFFRLQINSYFVDVFLSEDERCVLPLFFASSLLDRLECLSVSLFSAGLLKRRTAGTTVTNASTPADSLFVFIVVFSPGLMSKSGDEQLLLPPSFFPFELGTLLISCSSTVCGVLDAGGSSV